MNAIFSQDARLGKLSTVLGKDMLVLLRFTGNDHMNDLFEYRIDCLSTEPNIDFDAIIGTHASVDINSQNHGLRHYDGIVTEAQWAGVGENGNKYQLVLRPWFWLASRRRNQRIFHNKTVVQIIEELLQPYAPLGSPALNVSLTEDYPELEYTVQYRESDMAFAQRLMERFGINYHFTHEPGSHTMVLTDDLSNHAAIAGESRVYKPYDGHHNTENEHFWEWHPQRRLTTGAVRLTDYNFKTPHAAMETDRVGDAQYAEGQIEAYDYPGDFLDLEQGRDVVGLRTRAERGQDARHKAIGDCTSLGSGMLVTLTGDHVDGVKNARYLCLSAVHSYVSDAYGTMTEEAQQTASDGYAYTGQYVLMPDTAPLVPERKTRVPVVQGPQTAVVVGEGEIDCDEYGRILVHFHWDLEKAYSMRCRVSQNWASKGWGGMVIPRIGMEVVVEFLEGDPDKPLVTGCVYNGHNDVPYPLPAHRTKSVFRTDTHQGNGFNELMFEDENGQEKIYLHAEKDHEIHVENNRAKRVDRNQSESVGNNKSIEIGNNHHETIGGNMTIMVGPNKLQSAVTSAFSKFTGKIGGLADKLGLPDIMNMGEGNLIIGVGKNKAETVMISSNEIVGAAKTVTVGGGYQMSVQGIRNESTLLGAYEEVGQNKVVVAGKRMEFVCGKSMIQLNEDGTILIDGVHVIVKGSSKIDLN